MAERDDSTPVHEVRPTTQELRIPARFIPSPTVEPGHTFASVTDHISSIVLRKRMPPSWWLLFGVGTLGMGLLTVAIVAIVGDRKSTRLNSSHSQISYAVFCLKKKQKIPA